MWLTGPAFLSKPDSSPQTGDFKLVELAIDTEIRPEVSAIKTIISACHLSSQRFERFSSWKSLIRAIAHLIHITQGYKKPQLASKGVCRGWHYCQESYSVQELSQAKEVVFKAVQEDEYRRELKCISEGK